MTETEDEILSRHRIRPSAARQQPTPGQYTAKDFQLEVLERLADMQAMTESLQEWRSEFKTVKDQGSVLRFDPRTLVAIGAIALSITGYVLQDARNSSRRDAEVETVKSRVTSLERIAETNTEGRVRMEVELKQLHEGQEEIKRLLAQHESRTQSLLKKRDSNGGNGT
jgi:hypothetical protein